MNADTPSHEPDRAQGEEPTISDVERRPGRAGAHHSPPQWTPLSRRDRRAGDSDEVAALEQALGEALAAQAQFDLLEERSRSSWRRGEDAYMTFDADDRITSWNDHARELFGWSEGEVVGKRVHEVIVPPEHRPPYLVAQQGFLSAGNPYFLGRHAEIPALHREGNAIPVDLVIWAGHGPDGPVFNALAVDARKRGAVLCCAGSLVDSSDTAIVGHARDGTILTWNRAAEQAYGYTATEAIGQPGSLIIPPDLRKSTAEIFNRVLGGEQVPHQETHAQRKGGQSFDVSMSVSPIHDPAGDLVGFSTIARDVTEQRRMAAALAGAQRDLELALDDARRSEARTRTFLADAAHQLRTPIAGIRACAETLLGGVEPAQRDQLLADTVREASRAARLSTSLLHMARLDQGDVVTRRQCDLVALCLEEADRARFLTHDLDISVRLAELVDSQPTIEPTGVREILANLLDNARRHSTSSIEILVRSTVNEVEIGVRDDGPGIADDMVERAFDRFVSLDDEGGSGLGLPIARGLAQAQGGTLTYDRERGFLLRVPNEPVGEADTTTPRAE